MLLDTQMRRFFLSAILVSLSACSSMVPKEEVSISAAPAPEASQNSQTEKPFPIIDSHIHTRFNGKIERSSQIKMTEDQLFADMKVAGVVGAVAHTGENGAEYVDLRAHNIIHCFGVGKKVNAALMEAGLKSGKFSCLKIYLGYIHQFASDKNYEPAYQLAEKYNVPVVFHTGDTYSSKGKLKYADPLTIDEVAVDHPKVKFVIAHCGNPWIVSAAEVAYKNPNVYLDGSALLIGNLAEYSQEDMDEFVVKPLAWIFSYVEDPKKLMYGTDWPLTTSIQTYIDAYKKAIPKEHWNDVFYANALRVFGYSGTSLEKERLGYLKTDESE